MPTRCSQCHAEVETGEAHLHHAKALCEECWMEVRATPTRKTHWQYLQSIKTEYLVRSKKD